MKTNKLVATAVTAAAFVSFIGLAYAQSTSDSSNSPGTSNSSGTTSSPSASGSSGTTDSSGTTNSPATSGGAEPDSKYVAPSMDASTMPQPSTNSSTNGANSGTTNGSPNGSPNGSTSPTDSAPMDASAPLTERAARTDRN